MTKAIGRLQLSTLAAREERRLEGYGVAATRLPGKVSLALPSGSTLEREGAFLRLRVDDVHILTVREADYLGGA